ncbi:hypothetical protein Hs30E_13100 [Lactococcus hodotermopsidis]|uniref:DUF465 domain-containing protein n=1 Tax=Pseudolactococcus hodotermopsidis TaxID=2709157 RepID=A0A6A0BBB9_9LACT|nr:hypothetical protein [Lactococcus hodotermopsidis]GFH42759.1 hypothetical protein Hs30E_13100 [Lactococcus hodotermopsidis]
MKKMSDDEFEQKIQQMRELYLENHGDKCELNAQNISAHSPFLDRFRSLDNQKARLRRQLSELEVKRCRASLDKKSLQKLEQKLAIKKALFKKLLDEKEQG